MKWKCRICGKEIKSDWSDPPAGVLIDSAGHQYVVGMYHQSCLIKRLKQLIEGEEQNEESRS